MEFIPVINERKNVTHLVAENTHSKNKEEASQKPLAVRPRVEVSKPHSWQGRHWVIDANPGYLGITFLVEPKIINIVFLYLIFVCVTSLIKCWAFEILADVTFDIPKLAEEVAHSENDHH